MNEVNFFKIFILGIVIFGLIQNTNCFLQKQSDDDAKIKAQAQYFRQLDFEQIQNLNLELLPKDQQITTEGSIFLHQNNTLVLSNKFNPDIKGAKLCASVKFHDSIQQIGWDKLYVKTYKECNALIQVWSAGFLEGIITNQKISDFYDNLIDQHKSESKSIQNIFDHFNDVEQQIRKKINNHYLKSIKDEREFVYWSQIALTQAQTDGLLLGYNTVAKQILKIHDIYFINGDGQVPELLSVFKNSKTPGLNLQQEQARLSAQMKRNFRLRQENLQPSQELTFIDDLFEQYQTTDPNVIWYKKMEQSHCSAFIKAVKDQNGKYQDLIVSHSTWDDYSEMLRIFKHYDFEYNGKSSQQNPDTLNHQEITFSSYPGCITSTDDFYIIDKRFVVMETTLEILNERIYKKVLTSDKFIPDYMRIMISNRLATSGPSWTNWLKYVNSGTYNSQWMIIDMQFFQKAIGTDNLQPNTLTVYEQSVDQFEVKDMTDWLQQKTYWASYNVPYFKNIRQYSGFSQMNHNFGNGQYSFDKNPRAKIFSQYQNVSDNIEAVKKLMQQNDWEPNKKFKEASFNNPASAIAARFDIDVNGKNVGAIDAKITNFQMVQEHQSLAISGPTRQNKPAFDWSKAKHQDLHKGIPQVFNFDWQNMAPKNFIEQKKVQLRQ